MTFHKSKESAMSGSWGFPAPILPGKEDAAHAMGDYLRAHMTEWTAVHERAGITLESGPI